ncbi:MAG: hypothetical protein LH614_19090 [Pyrinomonadaceae bacterium]|nr:hypothetical protein [Pyrinomonadaceae bacterium]
MRKLFILAFVYLVFVGNVFGQTKPKPTPPKTPIITIDAVTKDGKAVILKSDGTWVFNENGNATQNNGTAIINIEAALVYRSGDVVPVSRTKFYLLSESAAKLLDTPELRELLLSDAIKTSTALVDGAKNPTPAMLFSALAYETLYPTFVPAALQAIAKAKKFETTSDFQGKASFQDIPKETYYLFVISQTRKGMAVWDLEVKVDKDQAAIVLDQNNAATVR